MVSGELVENNLTLWPSGQYAVNDTGVLRRVSLSYAEELCPIEEAGPAPA